MRFAIAVLMTCGVLLGAAAIPTLAVASAAGHELTIADQQQPSGKVEVDINTHRGGGGAWYTSPVWIAIGVIALVLLIVLIVMATRGGGTTIVRE